ncbi:S-layer homology domain-containing protein [Butyricicoccus faecihominis]|uniref:S-layer homology domain-containing protein n=1 Tax=Butyricicoccus faecihominis TaxID=1712515 RepID=UPI0024786C6C|nr:S-layer homology domain-containing protein [Butyricicoccus faecihominis]MCQ5130613.1 S-layer homology domain-containing protein [Butyricicoccus faecihominis]
MLKHWLGRLAARGNARYGTKARRAVALGLTLCMALGMLPVRALGADDPEMPTGTWPEFGAGWDTVADQAEKGTDYEISEDTTAIHITIKTACGLAWFASKINNTSDINYEKSNVTLANDIDLWSFSWTPIGDSTRAFNGTFDGNDKKIEGLYIEDSKSVAGLFYQLADSAEVKNLKLVGSIESTANVYARVGGIAGTNKGTISNCTFDGGIIQTTGDNQCVGGIAGLNDDKGTITGCTNNGTIEGKGATEIYVGGIAGSNHGTITNCTNNGDVFGGVTYNTTSVGDLWGSTQWQTYGGYVGGIAGDTQNESVDDQTGNTNNGTVTDLISSANNVSVLDVAGTLRAEYDTLTAAFAAAQDGDTIRVDNDYADLDWGEIEVADPARTLTLDLNGKTVSSSINLALSKGDLTITGNGVFSGSISQYGGKLTIKNGTFGGLLALGFQMDEFDEPVLSIEDGTFGIGGIVYETNLTDREAAKAALLATLPEGKTFSAPLETANSAITGNDGIVVYCSGQSISVVDAGGTPPVTGTISGTVYATGDHPIKGVTVSLKQGGTLVAETQTGERGAYAFDGVAAGVYNIVVTGYQGAKTVMVMLTDSGSVVKDIFLSGTNTESIVEVAPDLPAVVVGGVDAVAEADGANVTFAVGKQKMPEEREAIQAIAVGQIVELFLDLSLSKQTEGGEASAITDTGANVLEVVVPYTFTGRTDVTVYRKHGDEPAGALKALYAAPDTPEDGTFWADTRNGYVHIYASKFSTYAVAYTAEPTPSRSGGSSTTYYTLTATAKEGGAISPSGKVRVARNDDKTFTITPNEGFAIADVTVDGKSVGAVTSYTEKKVTKEHTIAASFRAKDEKAAWNPFADVKEGDWFYESVRYVFEKGLMNGTDSDRFSPEQSASRAMLVAMLWRLAGQPTVNEAAPFTDVTANAYYAEAAVWAVENGIVKGYGDNLFGPNDPVTREQLAAILYRYAQVKGQDTAMAGDLSGFADQPSGWASEPVRWAVGAGLLSGKGGGVLDPTGNATRAETAAMLMRYLEL